MQFQVQRKKFVEGRVVEGDQITEDQLAQDDIIVKVILF